MHKGNAVPFWLKVVDKKEEMKVEVDAVTGVAMSRILKDILFSEWLCEWEDIMEWKYNFVLKRKWMKNLYENAAIAAG